MCPVLFAKKTIAGSKTVVGLLLILAIGAAAYFLPQLASSQFYAPILYVTAASLVVLAVIAWKRAKTDRARLQLSEGLKGAMLEASLDAIVSIDAMGRVIEFNPAAERMFGYKRQAVMGLPMAELIIPPALRDAHYNGLNRYVTTRTPHVLGQRIELPAMRSDGTEFPVEIAICEIAGDSPSFTGFIRDITDRRAAESKTKRLHELLENRVTERTEALHLANLELARSNRELEQFAYVASHDLKEPLRMVSSYTQLLANRYRDQLGEDGQTFVRFAVDGITRMNKLIDDLLTYSRVGRSSIDMKSVECGKVVDRVLKDFSMAIEELKAEIEVGPLPALFANETELHELFQNLIHNALKFHGTHPAKIKIAAQRKGDHWLFTVRDNGIGIAPEYFEKIFVIFQRLNDRNAYPGTGIGLAVCKKIVEQHDGEIWVESEVGKGTTFLFTLAADRRVVPKKDPLEKRT